jgi:endonuclease-3 related protein
MNITNRRLFNIFNILLESFGKRHWWPGETPLEIMVGAILTQNTAWKNVEKAIANLKLKNLMSIEALYRVSDDVLAEALRPAGFFNIKRKRLKSLVNVLYERFNGSIYNLTNIEHEDLSSLLLGIHGIGPETADSIILYALEKPVFVVDSYTVRFLRNHMGYHGGGDYREVQKFFTDNLPRDVYLFNEFHALIVCLCQQYCKKVPLCQSCPLEAEKQASYT